MRVADADGGWDCPNTCKWGAGRNMPGVVSRLLAWVGVSDRPGSSRPDLLGLGRNGFGIGHLGLGLTKENKIKRKITTLMRQYEIK